MSEASPMTVRRDPATSECLAAAEVEWEVTPTLNWI